LKSAKVFLASSFPAKVAGEFAAKVKAARVLS